MASCPVDSGEIIAAVEPLLHVIDLDAIIDAVEPLVVVIDLTAIVDAVPEPRRTHDRRGTALAQRMRDCKVIKSLHKPRGKLADHTAAQIDRYRNRSAKTALKARVDTKGGPDGSLALRVWLCPRALPAEGKLASDVHSHISICIRRITYTCTANSRRLCNRCHLHTAGTTVGKLCKLGDFV